MATAARTETTTLPRWQRSLLPAMLGADHADRGSADGSLPRSARDWLVDIVIFLLAFGFAGIVVAQNHRTIGTPLLVAELVCGVPALGALWIRRRHPLIVGVAVTFASAVSGIAGGAAVAALFTVAVYCVPRRTVQVAALAIAADAVYPLLYHDRHGHYDLQNLLFGVFLVIVAVTFGSFVRARRELVLSLHERARRLESEQQLRVREAQQAERGRIAREMHDVLAHRISLLSVHAGALEFRPDAPPEEIARAAAVIRTSARAAQEELRDVIGVLRTETDGEAIEPPQPTLADLSMLVAESERAGMEVSRHTELASDALPPALGRTIYRVVQEALTNARKHAPGQMVAIELRGDRAAGVTVSVVNRPRAGGAIAVAGSGAPAATPVGPDGGPVGSGTGLVGLRERITLAGGQLTAGPLAAGGFAVQATLPWPEP